MSQAKTVDWDSLDWDMIRLDFELFGVELSEITNKTGVPLGYLKDRAAAEDWTVHPLAQRVDGFQEVKNLTLTTDNFKENLQERLDLVTHLKQELLAPDYLKLEATILRKAITIVSQIKEKEDPTASRKLKDVTSVLQTLLGQNTMLAPDVETKDKTHKITILTKFGGNGDGNDSAIQIQTS